MEPLLNEIRGAVKMFESLEDVVAYLSRGQFSGGAEKSLEVVK